MIAGSESGGTWHDAPMRAVVQRVSKARVVVDGETVGELRRPGLVVLVGVTHSDTAEDGFVLRYRVEETDDGFSGKEGSFTICSFWLVSALSEIGENDRARELCAKLLSFAGPLELYAEEIDTHSGEQLGNFPQAFTHLALINAVLHVIAAERAAETGAVG